MTTAVDLPRIPWQVPDWHDQGAACRLFPELQDAWHDSKRGTPQHLVARAICAACPVRFACGLGALERGEPWGIWGGLDRQDRKKIAIEYGFPLPGDPPPHGTNARRVKWNCPCRPCKDAHALYEAERRATARAKAKKRGVWTSPLLVLVARVRVGRRLVPAGQYLLPLPGLPAPAHAEPEPAEPALPAAA